MRHPHTATRHPRAARPAVAACDPGERASVELDLHQAWEHRFESGVTAGLALGVPLAFGSAAAIGMLMFPGWVGAKALTWQFVLGIGMACAVTALPILILLMEKLEVLRQPIGQRILRYASVDDIAIWGVLALILMDWDRVGKQAGFLLAFVAASWGLRLLMLRIPGRDRWYVGLIWLAVCGFGADWSGLHYMVGAFLAGAVMDSHWFDQTQMDQLRHHVLLVVMPVFFQRAARPTDHHQRNLHRAAADGGGQHHAHGAGGGAQARADARDRVSGAVRAVAES